MDKELEFIESLYDEAGEQIKEVYKEQKKNRDELLQKLAMVMLTYTVLDGIMSLSRIDKAKEYNKLSNIIKGSIKSEAKLQEEVINNILTDTVDKSFKFWNYNINYEDVRKIIEKNFKGKHFSSRVWENEEDVAKRLHKLTQDFLNGKINVNQIKKEIEKTFNNGAYNTKRLVETEINRCSSNAFDRFCIETDVKKVRYNATLDSKLCEDCAQYHDKIFDFKDKIEVPRHPLCRCFYEIADVDYKGKAKGEVAVTKVEGETLDDYRNKILNREYNLNINKGAQNKHIKGSNGYIEGRSYFMFNIEELQQLIYKYAGSGELQVDSNGKWNDKELVKTDEYLGYVVNKNKTKDTIVNRYIIHYGNKGVHIVPSGKE